MQNRITLLFVSCLLVSCSYFRSSDTDDILAKAGDSYLTKEELSNQFPENLRGSDSVLWVNNFINEWAKEQLFYQRAIINLSEEKQAELQQLVDAYHNELFVKVYKEALVKNAIDTVISDSTILKYYQANKHNFLLNEDLMQLRYVSVGRQYYNLDNLQQRLRRFETEDQRHLDSIALQFKAFLFNDSVWVKSARVLQRIPPLRGMNKKAYLKKSQFLTLEDSIDIYLVQLKDVLETGSQAPLEYVAPTIKQIILNRRKVDYLRQLDNDILNDAIKKKQFEVYE